MHHGDVDMVQIPASRLDIDAMLLIRKRCLAGPRADHLVDLYQVHGRVEHVELVHVGHRVDPSIVVRNARRRQPLTHGG